MKVLVTGAGGMLAKDIIPHFSERRYEVSALPHSKLDICDFKQVNSKVSEIKPDLIVNCAAYNDVDAAETNKHTALMVNGLGVRNLALACAQFDCPFVHISTDYVFDGEKHEPYTIYDDPHSISAYGESKLLGERYLLYLLRRFYLVRTSWLFGIHGSNFVETMLKLAEARDEIKVVNDQCGAPTFTQDLAKAIADLVTTECYGIYHITNQGRVSWYNFARTILEKSQKSTRVLPVTSDYISRPAHRPRNSALAPFPLSETIGYLLPPWEDALERYLSQRKDIAL
jgi:dTDP-4-dehydrorhamnose reductase